MIDLTKQYRTRDGREVINLTERHDNPSYPIVGHITGVGYGAWTEEGHYYTPNTQHEKDLIEVESAKPALLLDLTKPLQTKAQRPVRILSTEGKEPYPIVGYIGDSPRPTAWTQEGKCHNDAPVANLENVPPARHVGYVNVYGDDGDGYTYAVRKDRATADERAGDGRIACVRIEYTEGQFDE